MSHFAPISRFLNFSGANAALLAVQILAVTDAGLAAKLADARSEWKPKQLGPS